MSELAKARMEFQALVADLRPELHRYCARLTGSIVQGEDIVQDTLAKAFYALSMTTETPPLRPWLFRIAHNAAIDHLRRARHEVVDEAAALDVADDGPDPATVRLALGSFVGLPVRQRSAVILKDVLGLSLEEIAEAMDTTVMAVKAALVRGRAALRESVASAEPVSGTSPQRALLARYVERFNARDWDGLRAMLADDARLDLVSQAKREGRAVGEYYGRYDKVTDLRLALGTVDGEDAILVHEPAASPRPKYFILLTWRDGRVAEIRDYRYVPYVAEELLRLP
jgi:RNA polymerase sigma-70 factor (ECF subfamily)